MDTGKTLRGSANLAFDATDAVTRISEGMHRNIAASSWPLGAAPAGSAPGIAGFVYQSIRRVNGIARGTSDWFLQRLSPELDRVWPPGPYREAAIAALNGVCGDHLARTDNPLAIPMQLRLLLPPTAGIATTPGLGVADQSIPPGPATTFSRLFDTHRQPVEIQPRPGALEDSRFTPGKHLLVLLHGLCMSDRAWTSYGHNHGEALARHGGYTPVYALYNTGRHISSNGRELCEQLQELLQAWPRPVESITFVGFSMGGLLVRSALHIAQQEGHAWLSKVDKAAYIGTPHHGAVMERGGYWLQKSLTYSPYTAPLSALGRARSAGITDLRHGNVRDDDWRHHDEHEDHRDRRRPTPLAAGIEHFAIAATLSKRSGERIGHMLGDGLVHPSSATGRHAEPDFNLAFPQDHTRILYDLGHLALLRDPRVSEQLEQWLGRERVSPS